MDNVNAPQWADFNASDMSNVEEYFNVEHSYLEPRDSTGTPYASLPSTPNSKNGNSCYNTPRSKIPQSPLVTATAQKGGTPRQGALTRSARKSSVTTYEIQGITADYFIAKYGGGSLPKNSTPRVPTQSAQMAMVEEAIVEKIEEKIEKKIEATSAKRPEKVTSAAAKIDSSEENVDEENPSHNNTLVAMVEKSMNLSKSFVATVVKEDSQTSDKQIQDEHDRDEKIVEEKSTMEFSDKNSHQTERPPSVVGETEKIQVAKEKITKLPNPSKQTIADAKKLPRARPTVLTSQARRQSTSKYRRVSYKYVSLAEAVSKFQNGTPERFRSNNSKNVKTASAAPLQKARQTTKLTCAQSPLLLCKYRSRNAAIPNQEEREKMEMAEIRKNRIKPNPIKQSVMNPPKLLKKSTVLKKTSSLESKEKSGEPLKNEKSQSSSEKMSNSTKQLTRKIDKPIVTDNSRKAINPTKSVMKLVKPTTVVKSTITSSRRTMINCPKKMENSDGQMAKSNSTSSRSESVTRGPLKQLTKIDTKQTRLCDPHSSKINATLKANIDKSTCKIESMSLHDKTRDASILSTSIIPDSVRKHTPCKKIVQAVVSTETGTTLKNVEILHFGIPVGHDYKRNTKPVPFSFENRNRETKAKKEKTKSSQTMEMTKKTFHARPVPSYIAKSTVKTPSKPLVAQCPFSFQQRNENAIKRKKEMFDQMIEREKQARVFHAKPAPNFKPVFVRGASAENLRGNYHDNATKLTHATRLRGRSQSSIVDNRENTEPNVQASNRQIPTLKNPLTQQNLKIKKIVK